MFCKKELHTIIELLHKIYNLINNTHQRIHIAFFTDDARNWKGLDMDLVLTLSPTASALGVPVETLADGSPFTFDPTQIEWSVQDINIFSVTPNTDGTALFKPLAVGSSRIAVTDKATGATKVVNGVVNPAPQQNVMDINFTNITP